MISRMICSYNQTRGSFIEKIRGPAGGFLSLACLNFTISIHYAMKQPFLLCILFICTLSVYATNKACEYAGSNIGYIKTQTQKAIAAEDLNSSRYYAYKALNAIEKSRQQFEACDCNYANKNIYESLENLKKATRVSSLNGTRVLLKRALENTVGSLVALEKHDELHGSGYADDILIFHTTASGHEAPLLRQPEGAALRKQIDQSLQNYKNSLEEVVRSVDCKEAYAFAYRIFRHCEEELLKADLTESKKYYNLRTKQITWEALERLKKCVNY